MRLMTLPRYPLATLPTPLQRARNWRRLSVLAAPASISSATTSRGSPSAVTRHASSSISWPMLLHDSYRACDRGRSAIDHARMTAAATTIAGCGAC
jgi:hypothetical protein